ncbi:terpenoid cyclases/protein prenyltransferase alpha-alpha toroid [Aspergillus bertholletiae]|uniref:Terpenoid cyclases/protein prenyltransferase alpha-alpha toroid n=1 Tax=Aspergillus bertholletiae TaxID=1226010 RepID=A0A5N7B1I5_9EURO|nr:terpenoid cyclases/protein prenyltransferase alpha-alpha toroid [Aspergillus bertholletiae]
MISPNVTDLGTQASQLVRRLRTKDGDLGFMSCAIYDTAWVSMVRKTTSEGSRWLIPECFEYILQAQLPDGGWEAYACDVDGILNTAASLLALETHAENPIIGTDPPVEDIKERIGRAQDSLSRQLQEWNVNDTVHVGFEIILPALLRLLRKRGHHFEFDGSADLEELNRIKLSKFKPEALYSFKTTALHSLEAFIGMIDFDKVAHQKVNGSFMFSPSSTAAYLMFASSWDDECEQYLQMVFKNGAGCGSGGMPSAYPSTYFEISWILTTLLHNGYSPDDLGLDSTDVLSEMLHNALSEQGGTIGFAPSTQADADDTAKALLTASLLDKPLSPRGLLDEFEGSTHFRTYSGERDPSFTANCNVLLAFLSRSDASDFATQIQKVTAFLCDIWWTADGHVGDKWNLSPYYPSMLMAEAFGQLLQVWSNGALNSIPKELIRDRVSTSLYQALVRTLQTQNEDGSWGSIHSREETAYAILTIAHACQLPVVNQLWTTVQSAVARGRKFLQQNIGGKPEYLWVEKVSYGSILLSQSYVLAALKVSYDRSYPPCLLNLFNISKKKVNEFARFNAMLPLFSDMEPWRIRAAIVEGYMLLPQLRERRLAIFPRTDMEEDKYFEYIPFTWTLCNNRNNTFLSTKTLVEMMVISFLNYQADEFMEAVVGRLDSSQRSTTKSCIEQIFLDLSEDASPDQPYSKSTDTDTGTTVRQAKRTKHEPTQFPDDVSPILSSFIHHVMNHPSVEASARLEYERVKDELKIFLLSHIQQADDNDRFAAQPESTRDSFQTARSSFYRWVYSTSSDHTSCPYSFAFYQCLLSFEQASITNGACFQSCEEKYVAEGMCRHLAVMCRMYNDYGSLSRDREEKNLNSVNFPEFSPAGPESDDVRREQLFALAEIERSNMERGLELLTEMAGEDREKLRVMEKIQMFCDVTDLYGQIYKARDIASRM